MLVTQVDGASLGLKRERRDQPEDRQLRALARLVLQRPDLIVIHKSAFAHQPGHVDFQALNAAPAILP